MSPLPVDLGLCDGLPCFQCNKGQCDDQANPPVILALFAANTKEMIAATLIYEFIRRCLSTQLPTFLRVGSCASNLAMPCKKHSSFCFPGCTQRGQGCIHIGPRKYASNELVTGFINVITDKASKQHKALEKWNNLTQPIRDWNDGRGFDLRNPEDKSGNKALYNFFTILDDFFFRGALRPWISIEFADYIDCAWISSRESALGEACQDRTREGHVKIRILKPADGWSKSAFRNVMGVVLHEMTHAVFEIYECQKSGCRSPISQAIHTGWSGHGPSWRRLGQAIQSEANRSLLIFEGRCTMNVNGWGSSHRLEIEEVFKNLIRCNLTDREVLQANDAMFHKDL